MRIQFSRTFVRWLALPALLASAPANAAAATPPPLTDAWPAPEPAVIQPLTDGRVDVGGVIVDPKARTATVPVKLNLDAEFTADFTMDATTGLRRVSGEPVEYLLVHENGKSHESIFTTTVRPWALHTALLLLGLEQASKTADQVKAPSAIDDAFLATAPLPEGPIITIGLSLPDGAMAVFPGSATVQPRAAWAAVWPTEPPVAIIFGSNPWRYNGSYFIEQAFIAEVDGSFVSLITDPAALINSTHPLRTDDDRWRANPNLLLEPGDPAILVFRFSQDLFSAQDKTHDETP
ncbi:MAG: YdjY domain-containing protein [Opitutales bacterium]